MSPQRTVEVEGDQSSDEFLCVATVLPIRSWRHIIPFFQMSAKVQKQLEQSKGLVRYGVKTDLPHKRFWTFSVWRDRDSMEKFVRIHPHADAISKFPTWAGDGAAFVEWKTVSGTVDWDLAAKQLENPTFRYQETKGTSGKSHSSA